MKKETKIRKGTCSRKTSETNIAVELELLKAAESVIDTGVPFFDHMLSAMARHGRLTLNLKCVGDVEIDDHHSVEDTGICLGEALKKALGGKGGIYRFGEASVPMDDALATVALDLSGRAFFKYTGPPMQGQIGKYSEELTIEFLRAFADNGGINLHVQVVSGDNRHHIHEAVFKALGMALRKAVEIDPLLDGVVPSTKGTIS